MTHRRYKDIRQKWSLMALLGCVFCGPCIANGEFHLGTFEDFGIEENDFQQMQILPIHMMDNDILFLAAAAERDSSMNMTQRLFNNRWLLQSDGKNYSGSRALRRYAQRFIVKYLTQRRSQQTKLQSQQTNIASHLNEAPEGALSQFQDLSNYKVRLNSERILFQMRFKFN